MSAIVDAAPIMLDQPPLPRADPCSVVILGAVGDLSQRKLLPALQHLAGEGCLQHGVNIVGVARRPLDDDGFRRLVRPERAGPDWDEFGRRLFFVGGDLDDAATYRRVAAKLGELERTGASANRLFHLATPPSLADAIIEGLGAAGLGDQSHGWSRVVVEKPFGLDGASAEKLNAHLARSFTEEQTYRIDHYLGKETVQNILVFRFGNAVFEPIWNRNYIDHVEITAAETLGVEGRAGYYEEAGALRDMVTNHLLQLLSLTAMEPPVAYESEAVREAKAQVLRAMHPMTRAEIAERTVRAQYGPGLIAGERVPGYRKEKGVATESRTETYAALELRVENWRWAGVPFYLRTGKRLSRALTEIAVHFKRTPQALFARAAENAIEPNVIALRIQPREGITLTFGAKRPGTEMRTGTVHMDFCYESAFGTRSPDAYETLLLDAMRGDATLFTRRDMVDGQWRLVDPILAAWGATSQVASYPAGSEGPAEADRLLARNGHAWRPLADVRAGCDP